MSDASLVERARMAELSSYDFDWHPAGWESIDRDDVFAWQWPDDWHAYSRGVARATFGDEQLHERMAELRGFFARHGRTARWYVGPSTRSAALVAYLRERAGAVQEPRLMTGEIARLRFRTNPGVRVAEVRTADETRARVHANFPELGPDEHEREVTRRTAYLAWTGRRGGDLVAYLDGALVGSASWRDASDGRCVQFVGGWTHPAWRAQGVYSTLCAYRVARARDRGLAYACIVADPTTSGPIVAKAGFVDHGPELVFTELRL